MDSPIVELWMIETHASDVPLLDSTYLAMRWSVKENPNEAIRFAMRALEVVLFCTRPNKAFS